MTARADDAGALPLELVIRADSAAHRAERDVRDITEEQGKRNRSFTESIAALERDVAKILGGISVLKWLLPFAFTIGLGIAGAVGHFTH